jgi:DNA-binding NtrC family response regulator
MLLPLKRRILVVDDDAGMVDYLVEELTEAGYEARGTISPREALGWIGDADFDVVLSDIEMPEMRGLDLLSAIHVKKPGQLVLLITAFGSIDLAVRAVRAGACDFIAKPFTIDALRHAIERALRERTMHREIVRLRASLSEQTEGGLVARSAPMRRALDLARRAAQGGSTVLLTGESGTGKGELARFIHDHGPRRAGPFVHLNCAAIPVTLVESELFGARRGSFTDAREERAGLFAQARGGTLFLDEIGEMPMEVQPKLLHTLETGQIRPLGGGGAVVVDVRVIAATNAPLEEACKERRFRADLYYRLNVIRIDVPPLRERTSDIEQLVDVLLRRHSDKMGRPIIGVSAEAMRWFVTQPWPGNVRELSNVLERAVALAEHDTLLISDLAEVKSVGERDFLGDAAARRLSLSEIERAYTQKVLESTGGNKSLAAKILGIDRRTLHRKLGAGPDEDD